VWLLRGGRAGDCIVEWGLEGSCKGLFVVCCLEDMVVTQSEKVNSLGSSSANRG
jgi:hypothetical protein